MATETQTDLARFHQFLGELVADRSVKMSPEQAVALWQHQPEELAAIEEGLRAVEEGRTRPADQFIREFEEKYNIAKDA